MHKAPFALALALIALAAPALAQQTAPPETLRLNGAAAALSVPQSGGAADALRGNLARIKLPPGFRIALYAVVPNARHIAVGPQGKTIFVGTTRGKVWAVTGQDINRAADSVREVAPSINFTIPNGVCFAPDGTLYIAERNRVLAIANAETSYGGPDTAASVVVKEGALIPKAEESTVHSARVCRIGPDGKLYLALGQPYNVSPPGKLELYRKEGMGGIIRINRDGSGREVYATGIRNSVGLDFNPADKTLWFTDNQVDLMGDDIPPGEINRADKPGLDFGFPYYGGGRTRTHEYKSKDVPPNLVFPQVEMVAHAADLGMTFYRGTQFPAPYRGGIFNAQHGSWNRTVPIGARVMFTGLKKDGTADRTEVFAEGWLTPGGSYIGRPVDVAELPDGSLLVSDDFAGALYRISYEGQ